MDTTALTLTPAQLLELSARRGQVLRFEALLAQHPQAVFGDTEQFPLTHRFGDGVYVREIFLPKGSVLTGKIHKQAHPAFLMSGALLLMTPESHEVQEVRAPAVFLSPPGTKRAALALEDTVWVTVHANPTNTTDLAQIEADVIAPDYAAFEAWRAQLEETRRGTRGRLDETKTRNAGEDTATRRQRLGTDRAPCPPCPHGPRRQ